jgi:hypothetical protein
MDLKILRAKIQSLLITQTHFVICICKFPVFGWYEIFYINCFKLFNFRLVKISKLKLLLQSTSSMAILNENNPKLGATK